MGMEGVIVGIGADRGARFNHREITKIALLLFSRMQTFLAYLKTQNCALLIFIEMLLIVCILIVFLNLQL